MLSASESILGVAGAIFFFVVVVVVQGGVHTFKFFYQKFPGSTTEFETRIRTSVVICEVGK